MDPAVARHPWPAASTFCARLCEVSQPKPRGRVAHHRVHQSYGTLIGARAPHAGGWPVKMLEPNLLWVHFGHTDDTDAAESAMVRYFVAGLPDAVTRALIDPDAALPFANLTFPRGWRTAVSRRLARRRPTLRRHGRPYRHRHRNWKQRPRHLAPTWAGSLHSERHTRRCALGNSAGPAGVESDLPILPCTDRDRTLGTGPPGVLEPKNFRRQRTFGSNRRREDRAREPRHGWRLTSNRENPDWLSNLLATALRDRRAILMRALRPEPVRT